MPVPRSPPHPGAREAFSTGANGATGDPDDDELTNREEYGWKTDPWEVDLLGGERVFLPIVNR